MELATPRLLLDALRPGDAEALFACRGDPQVARFQGWCPADLGEVRTFIDAQVHAATDLPCGWFQRAIRLRDGATLIGDLGVNMPAEADSSVEFGISLAPRFQGNGYASEALRALFAWVFDTLGRHRIHASVDPRNHASMAMLGALGMRQEAHHLQNRYLRGEWVDDVIFAMLASEWPMQRTAARHRG